MLRRRPELRLYYAASWTETSDRQRWAIQIAAIELRRRSANVGPS